MLTVNLWIMLERRLWEILESRLLCGQQLMIRWLASAGLFPRRYVPTYLGSLESALRS